ncbi:hypothetical protein RJ55_03998 [Drechmeria coniospora]|nr:hypothetical protein RJ55_03998 [Drechmeria coniospora]
MTDLVRILPSFPVTPFSALLSTIEQHGLSTTDLLSLHPADIAKQTHLPLLDLKRLIAAIQASLSDDVVPEMLLAPAAGEKQRPEGVEGAEESERTDDADEDEEQRVGQAKARPGNFSEAISISTLDDDLDAALGGGIPVGSITEFAGESGAGKTQYLLALCLAVQLPPPRGLGKQALYISTESGLATQRLAQILGSSPILQAIDDADRPSLDNILSTVTPDLESQDHIVEYQVPVLLERHRIGLLVVDSVAANYRAEFERQGSRGSNMAARSTELIRLGALLRNLARRHELAVVVANQVADRFSSPSIGVPRNAPHGSMASGTPGSTPRENHSSPTSFSFPPDGQPAPPALRLEHQQRWFTGWGDDPHPSYGLKTPSLGLVWSTQISCRIALFKRPVYGRPRRIAAPLEADDGDFDAETPTLKAWRRWMKVVFASHTSASGQGLDGATEFEIFMGGLRAVKSTSKSKSKDNG